MDQKVSSIVPPPVVEADSIVFSFNLSRMTGGALDGQVFYHPCRIFNLGVLEKIETWKKSKQSFTLREVFEVAETTWNCTVN